jgi:polyisoprenoid-binding protein YceI
MTTATTELKGTYTSDPAHSSFGFTVRHMGTSTFRGTLDDVEATLTVTDDGPVLEGAAKVESISIKQPEQFRAHVLSEEFFDAANHPEVRFRSTSIELGEDGTARVEGDLTIKGITKQVVATGTWSPPREVPGDRYLAALELSTTFDRRDFDFNWQMEIPGGGIALDWDVTLEVHVELQQPREEAS